VYDEGKLLREFRKASGLTQHQVAKRLGFKTAQFISNAERNKATLSPSSFKKLGRLFGTKLVNSIIEIRVNNYANELKQRR
jgi:transcriptional regulator with XRE-family HTH domain